MYRALGLDDGDWVRWLDTVGLGTGGVARDGQLFMPGYPIFSKIAWMHIDEADLAPEEVPLLIAECDRALSAHSAEHERSTFLAIRAQAVDAREAGLGVQFGHT